ncbi:MAG: phosphoglycerate kinase [Planctomycetes bacterium]|nr:phosphoglycerate kinase [Planctomycetota bacterium]
MAKRGIDSLGKLQGKRVLVRVDFNVPLKGQGAERTVGDDYRLLKALPTIQALRERKARVVLCSHLGRPKGKPSPELSLRPIAARLSELLEAPVAFVPAIVGEAAAAAVDALEDGQVLLLENLRFDPGEEKNDPAFGAALASLADAYVSDAFGAVHRAHASVVQLAERLPAACGSLILAEVEKLGPLRDGTAPGPVAVVLGGAKLDSKIPVLKALVPKVDAICVGGGMAYTFLKAMGKPVGDSKVQDDMIPEAHAILERARIRGRETGRELLLPRDHAVATSFDDPTGYKVVEEIPAGYMGLDVGPQTIAEYVHCLQGARTVFWNGPLGVFEKPPFHLGTHYLASYLGYNRAINTVVGGGDSAAAARELGLDEGMDWVSTGGGASLEFVQGDDLPGLVALPEA